MESTIIHADIQKDARHRTVKEATLITCGKFERRAIKRGAITGTWPTVMLTHNNGIILSPREWRDICFLFYARTPPGLPPTYNRCDGPCTQ